MGGRVRGGGTGIRRVARRRGERYFPAPGLEPHHSVDIRGTAGGQVAILEADTGRILGSTGAGQAPATVHPGAVYPHQGESYLVDSLDPEDGIAFVHAEDPGCATFAREITDITVTGPGERVDHGAVNLGLVPVSVTHQVVGYPCRRISGEVIDFVELDMSLDKACRPWRRCTRSPRKPCRTAVSTRRRFQAHCTPPSTPQSDCCPAVASCDRGDIGGVSTAVGEGGLPTVFVYDGHPGGAGFAERGFRSASTWLARLPRRSRPASARTVARPVCSRPSAATATIRWTKQAIRVPR